MDIPMQKNSQGIFNVITPQPFSLESHSSTDIGKIIDEIMDKVKQWETVMSAGFFGDFDEFSNSFKMIPRKSGSKKPAGLFNSVSGETSRATNTLATIWHRMLTATDPYFEAVATGLSPSGEPLTEDDLYGVESVINRQLQVLQFKRKLLKSLRSVALFSAAIIEEPFVTKSYGNREKYFQGTDFLFRSLLQTGFDPFVFDIDQSDFIFTFDFPTKYKLREIANSSLEGWFGDEIEKVLSEENEYGSKNFSTEVFTRIVERKQRAGYSQPDIASSVIELVSYHGRLDSNNPVFEHLWESEGREDDIRFSDFTVGIANGNKIVRLHRTPYGTWHHLFKTAVYNEFELEPLGYGVGRLGKKYQRELNVTQSRANDALMMAIYSMWKVGRYAGLKAHQLNIAPRGLVELDDVNQLERLETDLNTIVQALAVQGMIKEDFRATVGATANLQAVITKATATESTLMQNEAIRSASVIAEIIAETFVREHMETCHLNNIDSLEEDIYIALSGEQKPPYMAYNRNNLPRNVGFIVKVVTDKDFRPERLRKLLEGIQVVTSIRQFVPESMNVVKPLFKEWFRAMGMSPRLLSQPVPVPEQLSMALQRAQSAGGGQLQNEVQGEVAEEAQGGDETIQTPMGEVPTSPLPASSLIGGL